MSDIADTHSGQVRHPGAATYLIIAAFLVVLTAMEITVFYVHALRPVLVPVLIVLAAAKFALVAMFYMHLKYDGWLLTGVFVFPSDDRDGFDGLVDPAVRISVATHGADRIATSF